MFRKVLTSVGMVLVFAMTLSAAAEASSSGPVGPVRQSGRDTGNSIVGPVRVVRATDKDAVMTARADSRSEVAPRRKRSKRRADTARGRQARAEDTSVTEKAYEGTISAPVADMLLRGLPPGVPEAAHGKASRGGRSEKPHPSDGRHMEAVLAPGESLDSMEPSPGNADIRYSCLEIEVSHDSHTFKLLGNLPSGGKEVLYECRVGLGNPREFPTPVGVYYVTHIYDDNPWWIPPRDRAWAAGQSPSRKVYGGIMAPLLKKRPVRSRKKFSDPEDMIQGEMKMDDYGYRFHGTNAPRSIGRNQSHGCVRMLPKDVKEVAALIKDYVGYTDRREAENGTFVLLASPVRLNLVR